MARLLSTVEKHKSDSEAFLISSKNILLTQRNTYILETLQVECKVLAGVGVREVSRGSLMIEQTVGVSISILALSRTHSLGQFPSLSGRLLNSPEGRTLVTRSRSTMTRERRVSMSLWAKFFFSETMMSICMGERTVR